MQRFLVVGLGVLIGLAAACRSGGSGAAGSPADSGAAGSPADSGRGLPTGDGGMQPPGDGNLDPSPQIAFTQVGLAVGINRSNEPASAGPFPSVGPYAYGSWLADLDGDGKLDYYAVYHGQAPHLSGLFLNTGAGFGDNLFTVSFLASNIDAPNFGNSNEMRFVGDLTGD